MRAGSRWKRFRRRLRYWLDHSERQRLLWEEMEFHIESMTQELDAQGMSEPDARAAAHRKFANMTQKSEEARSTWIARWMSDLAQDLRQAFRVLRRDAGFTTFVILIAGLGIGASSTIFSVVNAVLLRPLPFRNPESLVWIVNEEWSMQVDNYRDLQARNRSFHRPGRVRRCSRRRQRTHGNGRAGAPDEFSRLPVTSSHCWCATGDRKVVHRRGVSTEIQ